MHSTLIKTLTLLAASFIAGCANSLYTPPVSTNFPLHKDVGSNFATSWDRLVRTLSTTGFTVKKIDMKSGTIKLTFKSPDAGNYIDCGIQQLPSSPEQKLAASHLNPVQAANYSMLSDNMALQAVRSSSLIARLSINLSAQKNNPDASTIAVTVSYDAGGKTKFYDDSNRFQHSEKFRYKLTSSQAYTDDKVSCISNGVLEKQVLDIVQ